MNHGRTLLPVLLITVCSCGLEEAPQTLAELGPFLYEHHPDEDLGYMEAGLEQLGGWLDKHWDPEELAYEGIDPLTDKVVDSLDDQDRSAVDLISMAVITESGHLVEEAAWAMLAVDEDEVYPDMFSFYERTALSDVDCFLDQECERVETREKIESEFAFGLHTSSKSFNQYLWVETEYGPAFVQRNWLIEPPETNSSLLECEEQFYMNLFTPRYNAKKEKVTGFYRLQTTWLVVDQSAVPDSTARAATTSNMEDNSTALDLYLDDHCNRGRCN